MAETSSTSRTADGRTGGDQPDADPVIVARDLRRVFGDEVALDRLDLSIPRGSIFGFVGPSGSGKTTAVRLLIGVDQPTDGAVEVLGIPGSDFDRRLRRRIGYLPQRSVQFPTLSAQENLSFVASLYGLPLRRKAILRASLERTGLYEHRKKPVRDLSGGMQRRLALSAALVHDPEVLFLDEPTAGIDPVLRRELWDGFEALRDDGRTLFVTTQYVSEAAYCDRVGVLADGRLIAEDTPQGLQRRALGGEVVVLSANAPLGPPALEELRDREGVREVTPADEGRTVRIVVDSASQRIRELQDWGESRELGVESVREDQVSFDDTFAALMASSDAHDEQGDA